MTHRVFVYGTLKRGYPNNPLLEGSEFLGEAVTVLTYKAVTVPAYKMVETSFPVIMPDPSGKPVAGELYTVDDATLARLDQLEREGRSYDRVMIDATLPLSNGERLTDPDVHLRWPRGSLRRDVRSWATLRAGE